MKKYVSTVNKIVGNSQTQTRYKINLPSYGISRSEIPIVVRNQDEIPTFIKN